MAESASTGYTQANQASTQDMFAEAVFKKSVGNCDGAVIGGYDFNQGVDYEAVLNSFLTTGFQAQNYGKAVEQIQQMLSWSLAKEPVADDEDDEFKSEVARDKVRCKIWLSYTSNLISSGLRESIRFLFQHSLIQVGCSSAGGIEEDLIKCLGNTYEGKFELDGVALRKKGMNRIGNLLIPNDNYCLFNEFIGPILTQMHEEQDRDGIRWTPVQIIHRLGKEINNETSVCYWAYKNNIPIFCPSITDGSIGDMLFEHAVKKPGLVIDLVEDVKAINLQAMNARKTGVIVLGGGMVKHHVMNANLMRNGCDYCVYVCTAQEFDGSDAGARPDEAKSWGKIRIDANPVKIYTDATLVFPLMMAQTFAKYKEASGGRGGFTYDKGYTASENQKEAAKMN